MVCWVQPSNITGMNVSARPITKETACQKGVNLKFFHGCERSKKLKVENRLRVRNRAGMIVANAQANTNPSTSRSVGRLEYDHAHAERLNISNITQSRTENNASRGHSNLSSLK